MFIVDSLEDGYKILIDNFGKGKNKSFLFTCDDTTTSFLDDRYGELKDRFDYFNAQGKVKHYMNKSNINKLAEKCGLNVAKSWEVVPGCIPKDIEYPVVTKAIISTISHWKDDAFVCNNESELKQVFKKIKSKKILIQKFIDKKNELCIDGFSYSKGKQVFYSIATNYLSLKKNAYSNYMIVKKCNEPDLEKKLSKMFSLIGFEGVFSVEFLIDQNNNYYFLEINFRNSTWSYASTKAGINLPILWVNCMQKTKLNYNYTNTKNFKPFRAIAEFVDYSDRVKTGEIGKLKWLMQLLNCKCWYFINFRDLNPILYKFKVKLRKLVKRV